MTEYYFKLPFSCKFTREGFLSKADKPVDRLVFVIMKAAEFQFPDSIFFCSRNTYTLPKIIHLRILVDEKQGQHCFVIIFKSATHNT